jgi:hypothetical protein
MHVSGGSGLRLPHGIVFTSILSHPNLVQPHAVLVGPMRYGAVFYGGPPFYFHGIRNV